MFQILIWISHRLIAGNLYVYGRWEAFNLVTVFGKTRDINVGKINKDLILKNKYI